MNDKYRVYTPVLKGKRAEFPALEELKSRKFIYPLFEAVPTQIPDFIPKKMSAFWPDDQRYMIDLVFLDDDDYDGDETEHPLTICFKEVANKGQSAVPVTGSGRSQVYQSCVKQIASQQKNGIAIRLVSEDFEDEDELAQTLSVLCSLLEVDRADVDLIIDLESVHESSTAIVSSTLRSCISMLPYINNWRTLITVSGSFPSGIASLTRDTWNTVARSDWSGWRQLITGTRRIDRIPYYGDYCIAHPSLPPTGRATILGQLRYTTPDHFLVWKGHNVFTHKNGFGQFYDICASIVSRPEFSGTAFSWGDSEIEERAARRGSSGNAETWRKLATNHHMEMVLSQIANLP